MQLHVKQEFEKNPNDNYFLKIIQQKILSEQAIEDEFEYVDLMPDLLLPPSTYS